MDKIHACGEEIFNPGRTLEAGAEDYAEGHIPSAINLPKDRWLDPKDLEAKLQKNKVNVLYCYSHVCHLAASVAVEMSGKGYPVMELEGGWRWWKNDGFDIEK